MQSVVKEYFCAVCTQVGLGRRLLHAFLALVLAVWRLQISGFQRGSAGDSRGIPQGFRRDSEGFRRGWEGFRGIPHVLPLLVLAIFRRPLVSLLKI